MTYPQCPLAPQEALDLIRALPLPSAVVEWVVAQEEHKDGNSHLHAFLKYEKKVQWSASRWDLGAYHGNYQQASCWKAVQQYCKKGGNYIANIDTESAAQKKGKRSMAILTGDLRELVADGTLCALQLPAAIKARSAWTLLDLPADQSKCRGVWIYGPPGVGKSHYVRTLEPDLFIKAQNKWWDGYMGQSAVLIDDFDKQGVCLSHYLKIWSDRWSCNGEIKGATIPLNFKTIYITSNYRIEDLWPEDEELREAILRRFHVIHRTSLEFLGKRSPLK